MVVYASELLAARDDLRDLYDRLRYVRGILGEMAGAGDGLGKLQAAQAALHMLACGAGRDGVPKLEHDTFDKLESRLTAAIEELGGTSLYPDLDAKP
jgi:hypothetical protein